jgi:SAM-dependent methyltransferase
MNLPKIVNSICFPLRALFMPVQGKFGLMSLQEERMQFVASFCPSQGRVLDIGCGPGNRFIKDFIGEERGTGIDVFPYEGVENIVEDMARIPFMDCLFDTITLIAVGSHIPRSKRKAEFREFGRLLKPGGLLIMTEGEPITQYLSHKWRRIMFLLINQPDMDSERGMEEDEEFCMSKNELLGHLNTPPFRLIKTRRFMWGLNNVYIAEKCVSSDPDDDSFSA